MFKMKMNKAFALCCTIFYLQFVRNINYFYYAEYLPFKNKWVEWTFYFQIFVLFYLEYLYHLYTSSWRVSLFLNGKLPRVMKYPPGLGCSLRYQIQLPVKNAIQAIIFFFSPCIHLCEILRYVIFLLPNVTLPDREE